MIRQGGGPINFVSLKWPGRVGTQRFLAGGTLSAEKNTGRLAANGIPALRTRRGADLGLKRPKMPPKWPLQTENGSQRVRRSGPRSEVGGPRSENCHLCRSVPTSACRDPWLVLGVGRVEAGRKLGENHEITKKRAGNGILWRLGGSGGPTNPIIDRKLTQIHANGESGGTEIGGLGGGI